jgi:hypothetical protein
MSDWYWGMYGTQTRTSGRTLARSKINRLEMYGRKLFDRGESCPTQWPRCWGKGRAIWRGFMRAACEARTAASKVRQPKQKPGRLKAHPANRPKPNQRTRR